MLTLHDFDNLPDDDVYWVNYGGESCRKCQISYQGRFWMVKFPGNLRELREKRKKALLSYSSSPISEWLGSHIFSIAGIPVQDTILGKMDGKTVVACEHVHDEDERLFEFRSFCRSLLEDDSEKRNSLNSIETIVDILNGTKLFLDLEMERFFWDMFVVDAFIGNTDRNTGNWGIIRSDKRRESRLSPVYDNGSSFNCKMNPESIERVFDNWPVFQNSSVFGIESIFYYKGKKILPFKLLFDSPPAGCIEAVGRITPKIDLAKCAGLCLDLRKAGLITAKQSAMYIATMGKRFNARLKPAYEKYFGPLGSAAVIRDRIDEKVVIKSNRKRSLRNTSHSPRM